ncbi:MAG TPA: AMP-binding protein [Streptosporangiaceae bacterium]|jgi:acyl-coenzyme A synthetase/AMP-(fatty) acid ligase|nr:AMP-binding protein [Streptosporangiaceae bacterium]
MIGRAPINIGMLFDWHAARTAQTVVHLDRPFDVAPDAGTTLGGAALAALVRDLSDCLYAAGLRYGDRLAIVKDNHFDVVVTAAAAARIGAVPVMMAPIDSIEAVRTMIGRTGPAVVVAGTTVLARAAAAGIALADPGVALIAAGPPGEEAAAGLPCFADLRGGATAPVRVRRDDEPMIVTHTSGTTGVPKLVVHSACTALGGLPYRLESLRLPLLTSKRGDVVASAISFAHMRGLSWTRAQLTLAPKGMVVISRPDSGNVVEVLARHRPTSLEAPPNMFQRWEELAELKPDLFAQVKRFISTFDAVHPRTVRTFLGVSRRRLPVWAWGLGQSEIAGFTFNIFTRRTVRRGRRARLDVTNLGWPALVRVRVVDPATGRRQGRGRPGLIMVRTQTRCLTYLGEERRHRSKVIGPWWNTGDLGERAGLGRFRLVDREVDMVPGMSCIEMESALLDRLDRAIEVIVLAGLDGEPAVPVVCMRDDRLTRAEWSRASDGLPTLAEPRVVPWDEVPRTATWKVRRVELRERLIGARTGPGTGRWT